MKIKLISAVIKNKPVKIQNIQKNQIVKVKFSHTKGKKQRINDKLQKYKNYIIT